MPLRTLLLTLALFSHTILFSQIRKEKDLRYCSASDSSFDSKKHLLDVYYPADTTQKKGVFVFIHGGSWRNGKKNTYRYLARHMAKKGYVAVLINYRLSPDVKYDGMMDDGEKALMWIHRNARNYGGDPENITLAGHSAGGHLAAWIAIHQNDHPQIKRVILIDAFGLNMKRYFETYDNQYSRSLFETFTNVPEHWTKASPLYQINGRVAIPFLVLVGGRTYDAIVDSNKEFHDAILMSGGDSTHRVINGKKHIGMITQFFFGCNKSYDLMTDFMNK